MDERIIRKTDLRTVTGLCSRTCERMEAEGRFPRRVRLSARAVGWRYTEVIDWIAGRIEASERADAAGRR